MFAGNFAPNGWMFCNGQTLAILEYETLFNLIGTTYGGDGQSTFGLPNLQSCVPIHAGTGGGATYVLGQTGGLESVTLTSSQIPVHNHLAQAYESNGSQPGPGGNFWAQSALNQFSSATPSLTMSSAAIGATGGSQPHDNMIPFLAVNFIISLFGVYPSQT
jgi:microcystin-dependent protein